MQNIEINIHGFRFIEIETGYVAKPNRTAINRVPLSALLLCILVGIHFGWPVFAFKYYGMTIVVDQYQKVIVKNCCWIL